MDNGSVKNKNSNHYDMSSIFILTTTLTRRGTSHKGHIFVVRCSGGRVNDNAKTKKKKHFTNSKHLFLVLIKMFKTSTTYVCDYIFINVSIYNI